MGKMHTKVDSKRLATKKKAEKEVVTNSKIRVPDHEKTTRQWQRLRASTKFDLRKVEQERDQAKADLLRVSTERDNLVEEIKFVRTAMGTYLNDVSNAGKKFEKTLADYTPKGVGKIFRKKR